MKKLFNLFLVGILCFGLTACGVSNSSEKQVESNSKTTITTEELRTEWADAFKEKNADVSKAEVVGNYIFIDGYTFRYEVIDGKMYMILVSNVISK